MKLKKNIVFINNLRENILAWTRDRTWVSNSTRWRYNHEATQTIHLAKQEFFSYWISPYPPEALVPSIRDGEYLYWHYINSPLPEQFNGIYRLVESSATLLMEEYVYSLTPSLCRVVQVNFLNSFTVILLYLKSVGV